MSIHFNSKASVAEPSPTSHSSLCNSKKNKDLYTSTLEVHSKNQKSQAKPNENWLSKCFAAVLAFFKSLFCCSKKENQLPEEKASESLAVPKTAAAKKSEISLSITPEGRKQEGKPAISSSTLKPQDRVMLDRDGLSPTGPSIHIPPTSHQDKAPINKPQPAPAKKVQTISQTPSKSPFVEMEEEFNKRRELLEQLPEDPPLLFYEGMNPLQARLEILKGIKGMEQNKEHLLSLCKQKRFEEVAEFVATKLKLTIHTEFSYQLETTISSCVDTLHQAFARAKADGKLDAFLVEGFCDPQATKPDGAPYDIEACLEAKIEEWKRWAIGAK